MNESITVFEAARVGLAVARGAGFRRNITVAIASAAGARIHKRFRSQDQEVRVI